MLSKKEIITECLKLKDVYLDTPFKVKNEVIRHKSNNKIFALFVTNKKINELYLNLKIEPMFSDLLKASYPFIIPAYHMNKEHWISIIIKQCDDIKIILPLINESYNLTK